MHSMFCLFLVIFSYLPYFISFFFFFSLKPAQKESNLQAKSNPSKRHRQGSLYGLNLHKIAEQNVDLWPQSFQVNLPDWSQPYCGAFTHFPKLWEETLQKKTIWYCTSSPNIQLFAISWQGGLAPKDLETFVFLEVKTRQSSCKPQPIISSGLIVWKSFN